mgnify:CR=1 FL=1
MLLEKYETYCVFGAQEYPQVNGIYKYAGYKMFRTRTINILHSKLIDIPYYIKSNGENIKILSIEFGWESNRTCTINLEWEGKISIYEPGTEENNFRTYIFKNFRCFEKIYSSPK